MDVGVWNDEITVAWWEGIAALLGAVLVTALVATVAHARLVPGRRGPSRPGPAAATPSVEPSRLEGDPGALTEGLIGAFDLAAASPAVRAHIQQVLRGAGVVPLDAESGSRFDPAEHLAVDTEPAEPERSGRVARQVRRGWARNGTVLRPAEVVVWTS